MKKKQTCLALINRTHLSFLDPETQLVHSQEVVSAPGVHLLMETNKHLD